MTFVMTEAEFSLYYNLQTLCECLLELSLFSHMCRMARQAVFNPEQLVRHGVKRRSCHSEPAERWLMKEMHDMKMLLLQQDEAVMSLNLVATASFFPSHVSHFSFLPHLPSLFFTISLLPAPHPPSQFISAKPRLQAKLCDGV